MTEINAICYLRVSTEQQATSGLGIEAQRERTAGYAVSRGWRHVEVIDEAVSGTTHPKARPGLAYALELLDTPEAHVLVVSSLDRLSRSVRDVLDLADRARRNDWALAILDLGVDTTHATGRFLLTVLAAITQLERDLISERTTAALAARAARGEPVGRQPSQATLNAAPIIIELRTEGLSWTQVCARLNDDGQPTPTGVGPWRTNTARRTIEVAARHQTGTAPENPTTGS